MSNIFRTKSSNDLTVGKPLKVILIFAIPIFIGNIFQQLYNVVDTAVVGHVLKEEALAAIGASSVIYSLIISIANGMTNGFSIIIARYFGAKEYDKMRQAVATTYVMAAVISVTLTGISYLILHPFLQFLGTPPEIMEQAQEYISIIIGAIVLTMAYNTFAGSLRAIGNSVMPLVFLIISSIVNVTLDIVFVKFLGWKIAGAAIATVIAQGISVILSLLYIRLKCPILRVEKKDFKYDGSLTWELFSTGLSMGMMFAIVSLGTVALQKPINGLGKMTIAAHTAARKLTDIFLLPFGTMSVSASTFVSQNYGAGQMKRIREGIRSALLISLFWAAFCNILLFFAAEKVVQILTGSTVEEVMNTAGMYLRIAAPFYFILPVLLVLRSSLQGIGHRIVPLAASTMELVLKFFMAMALAPVMGYLGICITEPIIWVVCAIMVLVDYLLFLRKEMPKTVKNCEI